MNNIKDGIKHFIKAHNSLLKRWFFIASLVFMLMAIQIYMNYVTIIESTELIKKQNVKVQEEIDYINNYQLKYLDSNHAKNFLAHENNILKDGETVIVFQWIKNEEKAEIIEVQKEDSPRDEWKQYFSQKREKNTQ